MLKTSRPLQEKLVLFWHGHYATSNEKVRDYRKMMGQFSMLREKANGNLRHLLIIVGKDPAMLIYLDNRQNYKGHPNENFAREVMELFSLGTGNYTEQDIKEVARAFTGWSLDNDGVGFLNRANLHDEGEKTILGRTGKFKGEEAIDILLAQPACAQFISRKLYRFFVRDELSPELAEELATSLRTHKYEIAPFLEQIFLSRDFYSNASYATQIKSPVQLVVSTYKKLGLRLSDVSEVFGDHCRTGTGGLLSPECQRVGWGQVVDQSSNDLSAPERRTLHSLPRGSDGAKRREPGRFEAIVRRFLHDEFWRWRSAVTTRGFSKDRRRWDGGGHFRRSNSGDEQSFR